MNALRAAALDPDAARAAAAVEALAGLGPAGRDVLRGVLPALIARDTAAVAKAAAGEPERWRAAEADAEAVRRAAWENLRALPAKRDADEAKAAVGVARRHYERLRGLQNRLAGAYARQVECAEALARRGARVERLREIAPAAAVAAIDADTERLTRLAEQAVGMPPAAVAGLAAGPLDPPAEPGRRGLWFYVTCRRIEAYNRTVEPALHAQEAAHARRVNAYRELLDVMPLEFDARLVQAARRHSREMIDLWYFSHWSPVEANRTPSRRMRDAGYGAPAGENLTVGRWTGDEAFWKLFDSPPHHQAMVSPRYVAIGVGKWENAWAQDFGAGPRLMLDPPERRAEATVLGPVLDPQAAGTGRGQPPRDLATMKTYDRWGREQPLLRRPPASAAATRPAR